ncbi:MAG: hypothetical protein K2M46_14415 [Lachnospiraceae bacterium]|nr:hypothetical protein [Lachnospiraceae bacterium]
MSEDKEVKAIEESKEWKADGGEWILVFLLMLCFGGWGNAENPRITELEKKVSRLEGQMSMIGGKFHE